MKLNKLNKKHQYEWFTGFAEGDGSWQVDNTGRPIFIINRQNPQVLYKIKKLIGYGQINGPYKNKNGSSYYRYRVGSREGHMKLIQIFNGNLVLKKTQDRFEKYLNAFNTYFESVNGIAFKDKRHIPTLNDSWLSGFIDADGSFSGTIRKNIQNDSFEVAVRATFSQKDSHDTMYYLRDLLGGTSSDYKSTNIVRVFIANIKSKNKLIGYLAKFPLHSDKNIPFTRFKKIHVRLTDGNFKWRLQSRRAKERIATLVRNINKDI